MITKNRILEFISRFFKRGSKISILLKYKLKEFEKKNLLFFHIGRTGGNSLKIAFNIISEENKSLNILRLPHVVKPNNINFKKKPRYIFSIREPINRFYSVFYNLKRNEDNKASNKLESEFFSYHKDINSLCENLFNENEVINEMNNIKCLNKMVNFNHNLDSWFDMKFLIENKPFFIFEFEELESDFKKFCKKINYEKYINLDSLYKNHKVGINYEKLPKLSEKSNKNLRLYLKDDYKLYHYIISNKSEINS